MVGKFRFLSGSDLSKQISQIENAASQGFAVLIIDPVAFDGMTAVLEDVTSNYDIPVITLHGSLSPRRIVDRICSRSTSAKAAF